MLPERRGGRPQAEAAPVIGPTKSDQAEVTARGPLLTDIGAAPAARRTDPPTSHAAAAAAGPGRSRLRRDILSLLRLAGPRGLSDDQIAALLPDEDRATVARRRLDLVQKGLAEPTTRTRTTRRGCQAVVWRAVAPSVVATGKQSMVPRAAVEEEQRDERGGDGT
jgi:hypothetical protein